MRKPELSPEGEVIAAQGADRDHLQAVGRGAAGRRDDPMGHAEPERNAVAGLDQQRLDGRVAEVIVRGARRQRRQRLAGTVEELDAGIAVGVAARAAGVAKREAELATTGRSLLAQERQRKVR